MGQEITMKWSKFVKGTVKGTLFESEDWVEQFAQCDTPIKAAKLFNEKFRGRWKMSAYDIPDIIEQKATNWEERYAMIMLLGGFAHPLIKLYLTKEELGALNLDYFKFYDYELRSQSMLFRTEFTPKGNIAVLTSLAAPHPDSDDDCFFRIYSPDGEPLTDWQSDWCPIATSGYYELRDKF